MKECHTVKVDMGTCSWVSSVVPSSIIDNLVILNHEISENCLHGDYNWQSYGGYILERGRGGGQHLTDIALGDTIQLCNSAATVHW